VVRNEFWCEGRREVGGRQMTRFAQLIASGAAVIVGLAGCGTPGARDFTPTQARMFLESTDASAPTVKLPKSGVMINVSSKAIITEGDIVNAEVVQVELGKCLLLQVTPAAARDLYRFTVLNQGQRLVLTLNGVALGARRIDGPFTEGTIMIFVEMNDAELATLVHDLKRTSLELQKEMARKS
jgi:hypothetical protein